MIYINLFYNYEIIDEDHNVLNEIIIMFDVLKNINIKYYQQISFINNFYNEKIDVYIQKDVHGF